MHRSIAFLRCSPHLWLALAALLVAAANPSPSLPHEFRNIVFVVDITQSMNVQDMRHDGRTLSRLEYVRVTLAQALTDLPCGTKIGIALFANAETVPLFTPIEVCANYDALQRTLAHLEWRMAWHGSSHLRLGLQSVSTMMTQMPEPAHMVFLTDGDEAPPLNSITRVELSGLRNRHDWLLAGIGSATPGPIPKMDAYDRIIGYWSIYAAKLEPSQIVDEESRGKRDDSIASDPHEYYLSALQETYLRNLAGEIGASYVRVDAAATLIHAMQQLPSLGQGHRPTALGWLFALLAGMLVLAESGRSRLGKRAHIG